MEKIKGTGVALVTPFNDDKSIDFQALENLLNYVISGGVNYLVLMGTTGESTTLSMTEKIEVFDFCKKINDGRLPIVLGIGGNDTMKVVSDIQSMQLEGVDAILSVSPSYNKPSQKGIYQHYKKISESSSLPIILYNVPGRTSSNISASTIVRLAVNFDNIVAVKEASGDMDQIMKILKNKPADFVVLSGDDALTLPMICVGAEGVISVIGQSHPENFSRMVSCALSGDYKTSNQLHYQLYDYYNPIYAEGNPVGIKACLEVLGICKAVVRSPLSEASNVIKEELKRLLNK